MHTWDLAALWAHLLMRAAAMGELSVLELGERDMGDLEGLERDMGDLEGLE